MILLTQNQQLSYGIKNLIIDYWVLNPYELITRNAYILKPLVIDKLYIFYELLPKFLPL